MLAEFASSSVDDVVAGHSRTIQNRSSQRDRPLLSPAKFIPVSSVPSSSVRPPSKWSPVSSDWNRNQLGSKTSKTGSNFCIGDNYSSECVEEMNM